MTLGQLAEKGLLAWDGRSRRLFIDSNLALVMMAKGADAWQTFMENVYLWLYSRLCDEAWQEFFQKEELKAVREYMAARGHNGDGSGANAELSHTEPSPLTRQDIERIRRARRDEILQSDMEPPKVEGFEFFIVSPPESLNIEHGTLNIDATAQNNGQSSMANGQSPVGELVAVGHYDPETKEMEMATWSEVKPLLSQAK